MSDQDHFTLHAAGKPTARGRFVRADLKPVSFAPGLDFRPVLGERMLANFAYYEPHAVAPLHVHSEQQIVIVIQRALEFEIDGETRTLHLGDAAVVPPWVPARRAHRRRPVPRGRCLLAAAPYLARARESPGGRPPHPDQGEGRVGADPLLPSGCPGYGWDRHMPAPVSVRVSVSRTKSPSFPARSGTLRHANHRRPYPGGAGWSGLLRRSITRPPDTDDRRRVIVRADNPDSRSASRTTLRSPC
jgi:Cupin domain